MWCQTSSHMLYWYPKQPRSFTFNIQTHSRAQQGTAGHSRAQHSTAQHSTAQHSTAGHSAAAQTCRPVTLSSCWSVGTWLGLSPCLLATSTHAAATRFMYSSFTYTRVMSISMPLPNSDLSIVRRTVKCSMQIRHDTAMHSLKR